VSMRVMCVYTDIFACKPCTISLTSAKNVNRDAHDLARESL